MTWIAVARPATAIAFTFHRERNYRQRVEALRQWTLAPLDLPATLFLSDQRLPDSPFDYGWGDLCTELTMVCIGGSHATMMESPRRERLCAHLLEALRPKASRLDKNAFAETLHRAHGASTLPDVLTG